MTAFLLDLLHDLRQKRLAPVAIALLIGLVAIPVVLMKPAGGDSATKAPAPGAAAAASGDGKAPLVRAVQEGPGGGSDLDVFDSKDPFKSGIKVKKLQSTDGVAQLVNPLSSGGSVAGPSGTPPASTAPSAASGSAPLGSSGGGGSAPAPSRADPVPRRAYTYVVDLDFGREGHTRLRRGVSRLSVLPSERNPVAVFLGVPAGGKRAVFLLNAAFKQSGQGTCRPSRATCTFLHLSTDPAKNGHRIVDGKGVTHILRLKAIRRVTVREASRASRRSARARAGAKSGAVISPVFADEQR